MKLSNNQIFETVQGVFLNHIVMFIYYCGSYAYGLNDGNSDSDVTAVIDGFNGNVHLTIDSLDIFAYGKDVYLKKQNLDQTVPLYDRVYIDEILSPYDTLIYLNEQYRNEYETYKRIDMVLILKPFLSNFIEHYERRLELAEPQKSHYHIFRIRGILENLDLTGKYELNLSEPWLSHMKNYKNSWNTLTGIEYLPLLKETLNYIKNYKDKVIDDGLG